MIKIISFDLDGTLMRSDFGDSVWLEGLPKIYAQEKQVSIDVAKKSFIDSYDRIGKNKREWYDLSYWIEKHELSITPQELLQHYTHHIRPFDDVLDVLFNLSQRFTLIISSSAMREFIDIELQKTNLRSFFSHIFSATSDTNMVKKDPLFYQMICDKMNIAPQQMVHIGDHKGSDFDSPKQIGIFSFFLDRNGTSDHEWMVHSLYEFEQRIKVLNEKK